MGALRGAEARGWAVELALGRKASAMAARLMRTTIRRRIEQGKEGDGERSSQRADGVLGEAMEDGTT